jgi:hypothetical protein
MQYAYDNLSLCEMAAFFFLMEWQDFNENMKN